MTSAIEFLSPVHGTFLKDDFVSNDAVGDAAVGELGWEIVTIANAPTLAYQTAKGNGVLRVTTAATANGDGGVLRLFEDGLTLTPGTTLGARVRYPVELASLNFRVGLDDSVTASRPAVGVSLESDAGVLTCHTDSSNGDHSKAVTGLEGLTSGTTMVVAEWLEVIVKLSGKTNADGGPAEVDFILTAIDAAGDRSQVAVSVPCEIGDDEDVEPKIAVWQDSGGADAVAFEIDYFWMHIPRQS